MLNDVMFRLRSLFRRRLVEQELDDELRFHLEHQIIVSAASTRVLQGMLFGVTPLDSRTFLFVSLLFALIATFASYLPARRATKVDALVALRTE